MIFGQTCQDACCANGLLARISHTPPTDVAHALMRAVSRLRTPDVTPRYWAAEENELTHDRRMVQAGKLKHAPPTRPAPSVVGHALEGLAKITELRGCQNRQIYGCRVLCDLQKSILRFWPLLACFLRKSANIASSSKACPTMKGIGPAGGACFSLLVCTWAQLRFHDIRSSETLLDTSSGRRQSVADKRRHECRRGTHECVRHIAEPDDL